MFNSGQAQSVSSAPSPFLGQSPCADAAPVACDTRSHREDELLEMSPPRGGWAKGEPRGKLSPCCREVQLGHFKSGYSRLLEVSSAAACESKMSVVLNIPYFCDGCKG